MNELVADPLSPIDAATLWPQLGRLNTEVIATRAGEHLLLNSALAATGLTRLPRMPRTAVVGVRRGLGYRGVLVERELSGGAGWEAVSLRLVRDKDDETITRLLEAAGVEAARRGAHTLYLRMPEGSPHGIAVKRGGMMVYAQENLLGLPAERAARGETLLRPAGRHDRHGIFRLYCRVVPEHVRRQEAPTQQDWRAVHDSFDCTSEFVLERQGAVAAWVGISAREARLLVDGEVEGVFDAVLDVVEAQLGPQGTLVLMQYQFDSERRALARGYTGLGTRLLCARRLALRIPMKEVVAVPADTIPLPP
jgi:hypothetical protein